LTEQEKKLQQKKNQPTIQAGRDAYRMLIHISGNPHSKQPARDLWEKGWRLERRKEEGQRPQPARIPAKEAASTPSAPPQKKFVKHNFKRPAPKPQKPTPESPVITDRLVARFNRRHQTQV
jgi:hypothetical protein